MLGNIYSMQKADHSLTRAPDGHHSVRGEPTLDGGLKYREYIVYDPNQVYPEYVIEYKLRQ